MTFQLYVSMVIAAILVITVVGVIREQNTTWQTMHRDGYHQWRHQ